jgi:Zinc dependent phospholipase C
MAGVKTIVRAGLVALVAWTSVSDASAYSVLAHEANVDALWDAGLRPLLVRRFPRATKDDLAKARAYAYGGSVIQDLGYYPFGSHFFSNLVHYVRTGDFVATLVSDAQTLDEYAFALGALAHYASDNVGHPEAVNRAVALEFPKLRARYGDSVTYVEEPASHVIVEFSFDVVQAASGAYLPESYHDFIGFQVATDVLDRAFHDVYGLQLNEVFASEDLAIGTYRHAISKTIPEITRIAWRDKKEEIARLKPGVRQDAFVYAYTRRQYEKEFGATYRKPGFLARFLGFVYRLLPKVGPLRPLSFKAPTPEAEKLFAESFKDARARYRSALDAVRDRRLSLDNTDFDTGKPSAYGEYSLADDTYFELLDRLAKKQFSGVPGALRANIAKYYASLDARTGQGRRERKRASRIREALEALKRIDASVH